MGWIIGLSLLCAIIGGICIYTEYNDRKNKNRDVGSAIGFTFFIIVAGMGIGCLIAFIIGLNLPTAWAIESQAHIQSVGAYPNSGNHFVLGTGVVNDDPVYFYNRSKGQGEKVDYTDATAATIVRQDRTDGLVVSESKNCAKSWYHWIGLCGSDGSRTTIYLPKDYIKEPFGAS